jgi:hypothetical protein
MTSRFARLPGLFALVLVAGACSNNLGATPSSSPAGAAPASASAASSSSAEASTGAAGGGADACALLSVQDAQTALGMSGLKATSVPGADISYCNFTTADGTAVAALSYSKTGGALVDSYKGAQGAVQIPGIGDEAVLVAGVLYIKKGDAFAGFQLNSTQNLTPDKLQQIATAVGTAVSAHM